MTKHTRTWSQLQAIYCEMMDVVDAKTRSRMMSGIRGKNTKPELMIRSGLHRRGYRFRLHARYLPGRPDIVLPRYKAIILVHGCFWHGHDCHLFKWPSTRSEFWREKIRGNVARDKRNLAACLDEGWRTITIWECALKGKHAIGINAVLDQVEAWLSGKSGEGEVGCTGASAVTSDPRA